MNRKHIAFVQPVVRDYSSLDLGVTAAASFLNAETRHRAEIVDLVFHRADWRGYMAREFARIQPDYVAVSVNRLYIPYVHEVVRETHLHGYPVIIGGHEVSCAPEATLAATGADYACTGDAPTSLPAFLDAPVKPLHGIWQGSFISDLDNQPLPDYSLWRYVQRYNFLMGLNVIGSVGCPHRCTFCAAHSIQDAVGGRYFRLMSPHAYAKRLAVITKLHRPRFLQAFDPVATIDADWLDSFAMARQAGGRTAPMSVFARIDQLDERRIKALALANVRLVRVGIESGSDHIRCDVLHKNIGTDRIREIVALCKKHGIIITAYWILGAAGETSATIRETINLACELDCERNAFFIMKILTNEGLEQMKGCGATLHTERADNISWSAQADMPGLSGRRVELFQAEAYARTFSRRLLRLVKAQRTTYARNLLEYVVKGLYWGLDLKYLIAYSQVYAGETALM